MSAVPGFRMSSAVTRPRTRSRSGSLEGSKIYVTLFPCNECAKAIIQSGIKAVIYRDDLYKDTKEVKASKRMLKTAGVDIIEYQSTGRVLEITL